MEKKKPTPKSGPTSYQENYTTLENRKVSFYQSHFERKSNKSITLIEIIEIIRNDKYKHQVLEARKLRKEGKDNKSVKSGLNAFSNAVFLENRGKNKPIIRADIFIGDIDKLIPSKLDHAIKLLCSDSFVVACFKSPSGDGVKIIFDAEIENDKDYKAAHRSIALYIKNKYDLELDESCKDICRLCYFSYDPDAYFNPDAQEYIYEKSEPLPAIPNNTNTIRSTKTNLEIQDKYIKKVYEQNVSRMHLAIEGNRNNTLNKAARAIGQLKHLGASEETARQALTSIAIDKGLSKEETSATFNSGWLAGVEDPYYPKEQPDSAKLYELLTLTTIDYDRVRKKKAKELGIQVSTLDKEVKALKKESKQDNEAFPEWKTEMYSEEVNGNELLTEIHKTIKRYVIANEESIITATIWVVLTWLTDYSTVLPMLMITAPEKGCGKTIFLSILEKFACRPLQACQITSSALFRCVEYYQPTLLIDEADTFLKDNSELRGIINSGHTRASARVIKSVEINGDFIPKPFSTWGCKAISGIKLETQAATLISRSIMLPLRRKMANEKTENLRHADSKEFEIIKQKIYRWSSDIGTTYSDLRPALGELQNRDADNWEPLIAIAQLASPEWEKMVKQAALKILVSMEEDPSIEEELLKDIQRAFERYNHKNISTVMLLELIAEDDLAPWSCWNKGYPMTPRQLAKKLKSYSIYPQAVKIDGKTHKGYKKSSFADIFDRYISLPQRPSSLSVTQLQPSINGVSEPDLSVTKEQEVTCLNTRISPSPQDSNLVTDETPISPDERDISIDI